MEKVCAIDNIIRWRIAKDEGVPGMDPQVAAEMDLKQKPIRVRRNLTE